MKKCVILAAGDFPTAPEALKALREADYVCCCDSAAKALTEWGREPDAIVGDGDSIDEELKERYGDIWHQIDEQEDNDLTKSTKFCVGKGFTHITYLGATGKREDHTLGNISLLARYRRELNVEPVMITDYGTFVTAQGRRTFKSFAGQQVSIFLMDNKEGELKSEGLRWNSYGYREWWQGTLNESLGDSFTLDTEREYIVFQTHKKKEKSRF